VAAGNNHHEHPCRGQRYEFDPIEDRGVMRGRQRKRDVP
jgi:hypothetical protein